MRSVKPINQERKDIQGFKKITVQLSTRPVAGRSIPPYDGSLLPTKRELVNSSYWGSGTSTSTQLSLLSEFGWCVGQMATTASLPSMLSVLISSKKLDKRLD
jgi:hypothetical protein